jgi:hypothetical protein
MSRQATTQPAHPPMLFAFRSVQMFQVILALAALATGVGATLLVRACTQGATPLLLVVAFILGLLFLWMFGAALKAPTSLVAITDERSRIRFASFVDTVISNRDISGARLVRRNIIGGIGVRTNFSGDVALVTTWGPCVELTLNQPMRIWLIPKLVPVRATRLTLSVRNPARLVERFGPPPAPSISAPRATRKMKHRGT